MALFCIRAVAATHSFKFTVFSEQEELHQEDIIVISYNTALVSGMYLIKSLLLDDTNCSHPFLLCYCHYFTGTIEAIHYVKGTAFILQHLLQSFIIIKSDL